MNQIMNDFEKKILKNSKFLPRKTRKNTKIIIL